jgi:hypothetical protein
MYAATQKKHAISFLQETISLTIIDLNMRKLWFRGTAIPEWF